MRMPFALKNGLVISAGYLVLPLLSVLVGCAPGAVSQEQVLLDKGVTVERLAHHRWVLKTIDGEAVLSNPVGAYGKGLVPELDFGEAQHVGGYAGCNQFSGEFELNDQGQFRVQRLATTMMMCADAAMELEQRYALLLSQWSDIEINGAVLSLKQGEQLWSFSLLDWVQ